MSGEIVERWCLTYEGEAEEKGSMMNRLRGRRYGMWCGYYEGVLDGGSDGVKRWWTGIGSGEWKVIVARQCGGLALKWEGSKRGGGVSDMWREK